MYTVDIEAIPHTPVPAISFPYRRKLWVIFLVLLFLHTSSAEPLGVYAAPLNDLTVVASSNLAGATGTTHTLTSTIATTDTIQQINLRYSTTYEGLTKPANLSIASATLASTTNLGSGWILDTSNASSGQLFLTNDIPQSVSSGSLITIVLDGITNWAINDCEPANNGLADTCRINLTTYQDAGSIEIDRGNTLLTLYEYAHLSFEIAGVASGNTHNGITPTSTSTPTTLPFGTLIPGSVGYAAHVLTIETNAPGGYTITAALLENIHGSYNNAEIDPFAGPEATWTSPQAWSTPDGITPNNNTGWFGANTSDTRITGWSGNTQAKIGPFGTTPRIVAYSSEADSGSTIYVSYAIGVNTIQPADEYTGNLVYTVQTNY